MTTTNHTLRILNNNLVYEPVFMKRGEKERVVGRRTESHDGWTKRGKEGCINTALLEKIMEASKTERRDVSCKVGLTRRSGGNVGTRFCRLGASGRLHPFL